jgi:hypothetical protein
MYDFLLPQILKMSQMSEIFPTAEEDQADYQTKMENYLIG